MRMFPLNHRTALAVRLSSLAVAVLFLAVFMAPRASMQEDSERVQVADRISERTTLQAEAKPGVPQPNGDLDTPGAPSPKLVTATTYPFTSAAGVVLEDMSTGTTQLVAAASDDGNSALTNIGFDFWYDGVRFTQFAANANGFVRMGAVPVAASPWDNSVNFASTNDAPKIAAYFDDIWVGTNGNVRFKVIGAAPTRKLIVEWNNMTIPRGGAAAVGAGTFQMWLFETTGVIEFVYGSGIVLNSANGGYSIGLQSGAATNFASVTSTGPTVSYAAANNTQTNAITSGTGYIFTPNVPNAPSNNLVSGITPNSLTLNWLDNASNEVGDVIYRSTDNVIFTFITQTAANSTSFTDTGLSPGTNYFYTVQAVTEGALSTITSFGATTAPAGADSCLGAGGDWNNPGTWTDGSVPTSSDNVTIGSGCTVTVNVTDAVALDVTIDSGGTLQSPTTGAVTTNNLTLNGSMTNNGTLDFSTNGDTSAAILTFGAAVPNVTFGGTGATTDIRAINVAKGAQATVVEMNPTNFTVRGVTTDVAGFLTITSGTFKISGTFTMTNRVFTTATYIIPLLGGFWLNNPNFTVPGQAGGTTCANNGLLRMTQGVFGIGVTGGDGMGGGTGATFIVEGGTINAIRIDPQNAVSWTQTAGTLNMGAVANTRSLFGTFELFSTASTFTMSGGTINHIQASVGATPIDWQVRSTVNTITGGIVNFGTGATTTNFNFRLRANVPNFVIDNTTNNKTATATAQVNLRGTTLISSGATFVINGQICLVLGPLFTNNGTLTGTAAATRYYFLGGLGATTYQGTGVVTAPLLVWEVDNVAGVTIDPGVNQIITARFNNFSGGLTGSGKLTIGNGGATTAVVQLGVAAAVNPVTGFDVPPVFNPGTGGAINIYAQEITARTTGNEILPSRTLTTLNVSNTLGITIAGGDITVNGAGAGAITMTNAPVTTGANTLYFNSALGTVVRTLNGYVIGNFKKAYTAAASKSFEVGTANGFSPVTVNATAGTFPSDFTVKATQGPHPAVNPATSIQRYWTLTEGGDITATLTFNYLDPTDIMGTEANYKVIRIIGGTSVAFPLSVVTPAANTATLAGVSNFSDWTVGEIAAPTAAPATISGTVTSASGTPLAGVTIRLSGGRSAMTISDSNGAYRFLNVETNSFYTVTPSLVNHNFSPASRSFSLLGNQTDAVFTGTRDTLGSGNAIDTPEYFVRQHYLDFLGREPDNAGLNFWSDQIRGCGNDFNCMERRTINVSAAYFLSIEFQKTGGLVDGLYRASYGRAPLFEEFMPDTATIGREVVVNEGDWEGRLTRNTDEFLAAWVQRAAFRAAYDNLGNDGYVDALISNTRVSFTERERASLVSGLNGGTLSRAGVLERVARNETFARAKFNEAFVRMQYFGYLRRNPDDSGLHFWLNKLNEFDGNFEQAEMVKAFLVSGEYRDRFRP